MSLPLEPFVTEPALRDPLPWASSPTRPRTWIQESEAFQRSLELGCHLHRAVHFPGGLRKRLELDTATAAIRARSKVGTAASLSAPKEDTLQKFWGESIGDTKLVEWVNLYLAKLRSRLYFWV